MYGNEGREKSLNPHCVSRMAAVAGGVSRRMSRWKENIRKLRNRERCVNLASLFGFQEVAGL